MGGSTVNGTDQFAHRFNRVVNGICNSAGKVFRHLCFNGQIAIGKFRQFVHQTQNGILIPLGTKFRFSRNVLDFGILRINKFVPKETRKGGAYNHGGQNSAQHTAVTQIDLKEAKECQCSSDTRTGQRGNTKSVAAIAFRGSYSIS